MEEKKNEKEVEQQSLGLVLADTGTALQLKPEDVPLYWQDLEEQKAKIENVEKKFKDALLAQMVAHRVKNFTIDSIDTQFICKGLDKETVTFDTQKFLEQEGDSDIGAAFSTTTVTESIDIDKLLADHPELKEKYTKKNYETTVDIAGLRKSMPKVFDRFGTVTGADSKPTLSVVSGRSKKGKAKKTK